LNPSDIDWLENRIYASIGDDFYLDRDEERRIKEEASAKGMSVKEVEVMLRVELEKLGAVSERVLVDELEELLRQFTDVDKLLDKKEERDAFDQVVIPASGKKKGLDPRVAEDYVASFCRANGIKRSSDTGNKKVMLLTSIAIVILVAVVAMLALNSSTGLGGIGSGVILTEKDRAVIDDQLRRAKLFVEKAQYTDPPENSAKACLDRITQIDPNGQYRGNEVKAISSRIVGHYLQMAEGRALAGDKGSARKWISRARLMNADRELIAEKEKDLGL